MKIRWTNKFSQETGFVKTVSKAKNCFINTFEASEARVFKNEKDAKKVIATLTEMGEAENNIFTIEA
jgi:uncharacterized membrane protein